LNEEPAAGLNKDLIVDRANEMQEGKTESEKELEEIHQKRMELWDLWDQPMLLRHRR